MIIVRYLAGLIRELTWVIGSVVKIGQMSITAIHSIRFYMRKTDLARRNE